MRCERRLHQCLILLETAIGREGEPNDRVDDTLLLVCLRIFDGVPTVGTIDVIEEQQIGNARRGRDKVGKGCVVDVLSEQLMLGLVKRLDGRRARGSRSNEAKCQDGDSLPGG